MAFGFSKSRTSPIAIDFGADSVKLVQVVPDDPPQLVAAAAKYIPEDVRYDVSARSVFLGDALRDLLRQAPFKGRRAVLSFPAFQTLMQHLEVGKGDGESLDELVGQQLRARLGLEPSRMLIRHFPVRQFSRNGTPLNEVICLAAAREVIMGYIDIAHRCKLDVVGMHSEPIAVLKAFEHLYRTAADAERVTCFVDVGAATTKVMIAHGTKLVSAKSIHAGGDSVTRQIAQQRGCSFDEASRMRKGGGADGEAVLTGAGAPAAEEQAALAATGLPSLDVQRAATKAATKPARTPEPEVVEYVSDELRLCLRYHASIFAGRTVEKLVFVGGEARNRSVCQQIARSVRVAAQLGDPFARVSRLGAGVTGVDVNQPQPGWAVPMGLCLCEEAA